MNNPFNNDGTLFYISSRLPVIENGSSFSALTYTQIRGVRSIGDLGGESIIQVNNFIGIHPQNMILGSTPQTLQLELIKISDEGQTALKEADHDKIKRSYKATQKDGTTYYFTGTVSSRLSGLVGLADTKISIELNSKIIEI